MPWHHSQEMAANQLLTSASFAQRRPQAGHLDGAAVPDYHDGGTGYCVLRHRRQRNVSGLRRDLWLYSIKDGVSHAAHGMLLQSGRVHHAACVAAQVPNLPSILPWHALRHQPLDPDLRHLPDLHLVGG